MSSFVCIIDLRRITGSIRKAKSYIGYRWLVVLNFSLFFIFFFRVKSFRPLIHLDLPVVELAELLSRLPFAVCHYRDGITWIFNQTSYHLLVCLSSNCCLFFSRCHMPTYRWQNSCPSPLPQVPSSAWSPKWATVGSGRFFNVRLAWITNGSIYSNLVGTIGAQSLFSRVNIFPLDTRSLTFSSEISVARILECFQSSIDPCRQS